MNRRTLLAALAATAAAISTLHDCVPPAMAQDATSMVEHRAGGADTVGRDAFRAWLGERRRGMPDLTYTIEELLAQNDLAAIRWTAHGTDTGGMFGQPPTGTAATWAGIGIYRVACGQTAEVWTKAAAIDLMGQLGMLPEERAPTPAP